MIIGISGKIGSGKDLVGSIIQYLIICKQADLDISYDGYLEEINNDIRLGRKTFGSQDFIIKKFADKLKDTVCLWTGCTREQLEDVDFKDSEIGEDWIKYAYAIGHGNRDGERVMWSMCCTKEKYEEEQRINWQTTYKQPLTYRWLLQLLGTECGRNTIHNDIWVNTLFTEYKITSYHIKGFPEAIIFPSYIDTYDRDDYKCIYPNWIITDTRFPNELEAIKKRGGISIRVNRYPERICVAREGGIGKVNQTVPFDVTNQKHLDLWKGECSLQHPSETSLDDATFDYIIDNNSTIEDLIMKVKDILVTEKII